MAQRGKKRKSELFSVQVNCFSQSTKAPPTPAKGPQSSGPHTVVASASPGGLVKAQLSSPIPSF